ncbi:hypothetical protein [Paenibacillus sp. NPDC056722]|uniref:hypothetical protein n=1 Tax=Bacillati TaxID=1783272 RepID=UPI0036A5B230
MTDSERALAQEILDEIGAMRLDIREMSQEGREAGERLHWDYQEIQQEMREFSDELRSWRSESEK